MITHKIYRFYVGIDPGTTTGIALWNKPQKQLVYLKTMSIHDAMDFIKDLIKDHRDITFVRVEDARQRKFFGTKGKEALQGAGSIKRDSTIWDDFLKSLNANYLMSGPAKGTTKWDDKKFRLATGWPGRTNEHMRDSALLVINS